MQIHEWADRFRELQNDGVDFERYVVFKTEDARAYLDEEEKEWLKKIQRKICGSRLGAGKNPRPFYLLVNIDEPYAKDVWEIIKSK
jgi:hypothetical protein